MARSTRSPEPAGGELRRGAARNLGAFAVLGCVLGSETSQTALRRLRRSASLSLALAIVAAWLVLAPSALRAETTAPTQTPPPAKPQVSATLEGCVTSAEPAERAATFAGEMAVIPGAAKMQMRIEVLERLPREFDFHAVAAPGLGVWRTAAPGVKTYRYLKEVTNLAAPAVYRAAVRFRWLNAKGKLMRAAELRTPRCAETLTPGSERNTTEEPTSAG